MAEMTQAELAALGVEWPPTEDELPYDDGMPMESQRHALQLQLLIDPLCLFWADREDVYVAGNMFVYFSLDQVRNRDFQGPDFFVVLDVPKRERKSWVVWQEGKSPDVVIELISESTAALDKGEKRRFTRTVYGSQNISGLTRSAASGRVLPCAMGDMNRSQRIIRDV